ncbi:hypothetical protein ACSHXN_10380 [Streptomyces sp. HUAS TT11]
MQQRFSTRVPDMNPAAAQAVLAAARAYMIGAGLVLLTPGRRPQAK